ncbi:MAG: DUF402 domain-containing protein [Patescibacteria group bacterium]
MTKIISYDHNHKEFKTWEASILAKNNDFIITKNIVPFKITYSTKKEKEFSIQTFITHFHNEWFNIITVYDLDGVFQHWYVNITTPITFSENTISYDDLLLDLRVYPNYTWDVLDQDEYDEHRYEIDDEVNLQISKTMEKLAKLISDKSTYFDNQLLKK